MGSSSDIGYARTSDGIDVAYAVHGDGPTDLVLIHGFTTHLDFIATSPWHMMWRDRLAENHRVIEFDKRGSGLSDRSLGAGSLEDRTNDAVAVMDAAGVTRASVVGISEGGPMALTLAAMHPDRVDRVLLYGTFARNRVAPDYPIGHDEEVVTNFLEWVEEVWGSGEAFATFFINHAPDPEAATAAMAKFERNACTRQMAGALMRLNAEIDVRPLLSSVGVPTMVMHTRDDPLIPFSFGQYIADHIPGAVFVGEEGDYHCTWLPDEFAPLLAQGLAFLANESLTSEAQPTTDVQRMLSTILFTDIVGSTDMASELGDERWGHVLDQHHRRARQAAMRRRGTVVKTTGDGMLALFDGPSRAIQAAHDLRRDVRDLGIELRFGIHTGEIERSEHDVAGIGVHIAARVMALAAPSEVLVSRTVRDLAAGSSIVFDTRGSEVLRGVPGEWELFAVADLTSAP